MLRKVLRYCACGVACDRPCISAEVRPIITQARGCTSHARRRIGTRETIGKCLGPIIGCHRLFYDHRKYLWEQTVASRARERIRSGVRHGVTRRGERVNARL